MDVVCTAHISGHSITTSGVIGNCSERRIHFIKNSDCVMLNTERLNNQREFLSEAQPPTTPATPGAPLRPGLRVTHKVATQGRRDSRGTRESSGCNTELASAGHGAPVPCNDAEHATGTALCLLRSEQEQSRISKLHQEDAFEWPFLLMVTRDPFHRFSGKSWYNIRTE